MELASLTSLDSWLFTINIQTHSSFRSCNLRSTIAIRLSLRQPFFFKSVYTHSVILVIQAIWLVRSGEYKAEQNRCRELGILPKFHSENFLKIQEYPSVDGFEGKETHGV